MKEEKAIWLFICVLWISISIYFFNMCDHLGCKGAALVLSCLSIPIMQITLSHWGLTITTWRAKKAFSHYIRGRFSSGTYYFRYPLFSFDSDFDSWVF